MSLDLSLQSSRPAQELSVSSSCPSETQCSQSSLKIHMPVHRSQEGGQAEGVVMETPGKHSAPHCSTFGKMKRLPFPWVLDHSQLFLLFFKEKASKAVTHFLGSFRVGGTAPRLPLFCHSIFFRLAWLGRRSHRAMSEYLGSE